MSSGRFSKQLETKATFTSARSRLVGSEKREKNEGIQRCKDENRKLCII